MSDFNDSAPLDDMAPPAIDDVPADEAWDAPPDLPPVVDELPPADDFGGLDEPPMPPVDGDFDTPPPAAEGTEPATAPPVPVAGPDGLPPALPDEAGQDDHAGHEHHDHEAAIDLPVELDGGDADGPPMPPITGDTDVAPPGPGEVDLGQDGPPVAPTAPNAGLDQGQSPVPPMGDQAAADQAVADQGQTPVPPMGNEAADQGQSPVPPMGNEAADQGQTQVIDDGVQLGDDGPPMPPVEGDRTTPPPTGNDAGVDTGEVVLPTETGQDLPQDQEPQTGEPTEATGTTTTDAEWSVAVAPGTEQATAAAIVDVFAKELGIDDAQAAQMTGLLEAAAADGTITMAEVEAAYAQSGMTVATVEPTEETLTELVDRGPAEPTLAMVGIDGNPPEVYRMSRSGEVLNLESVATREVHVVETHHVVDSWQAAGGRVIVAPAPPAPAPVEAAPEVDAAALADAGSGSGSNAGRNALIAGAVLIPLAGAGAFLATRKQR